VSFGEVLAGVWEEQGCIHLFVLSLNCGDVGVTGQSDRESGTIQPRGVRESVVAN